MLPIDFSIHVAADDRPWPLPDSPWEMAMRWHDLAFLHWPVAAELLRPLIPIELSLDTFDGTAWIGVVPFRMSGVRPRFVPSLPGLSAFPEINVRTYVTAHGKPGVWFFSLDARNRLAVRVARAVFGLPYFDAQIELTEREGSIQYQSRRTHRAAPPADFHGSYRPSGDVYRTERGELDHFLTERYCLYTRNRRGDVCRGDIHHSPWPLQAAEVDIRQNSMSAPIGLDLPGPPLVHFARKLDVIAWFPDPI